MNKKSEGGLELPQRNVVDWNKEEYWDEQKLDEETRRQFDVCHGCRRCFNLCDSFPRLFDLIDESETFELDSVKSKDFNEVVEACTLCDMCFMVSCPYVPPHEFAIDFSKLMLRHKAVNYNKGKVSFSDKQLAKIDRNGKILQKSRAVSNALTSVKNKPTRYIMEKTLNIDKRASLPKYSKPYNKKEEVNKKGESYGEKVVIFSTCYGNYFNSSILESAEKILNFNGIETLKFYEGCCGMPQLEQGNLKEVATSAKKISKILSSYIDEGKKIITLIPSCSLMIKSEWPLLLPNNEFIKKLAINTFDIDEYIVDLAEKNKISKKLKPLFGGISLHLSCHSRAQNIGPKAHKMLKLIPKTNIDLVEKCSGHGGSWGIKKGNFDIALKIGKVPTKTIISKNNRYISSTCPLAGEHITQIKEINEDNKKEKITSRHPIELLAFSYGLINI